jgi:hypothetical protein
MRIRPLHLMLLSLSTMSANASVTYNWVPLTQAGHPGLYDFGKITFEDAAVTNAGFSARMSCDSEPITPPYDCTIFEGDPSQASMTTASIGGMGPPLGYAIDVSFNLDGTLSGETIYGDLGANFFVNGTGTNWSGQINSDLINCDAPNPCQVTGYWHTDDLSGLHEDLPEAPTLPLAVAGILAAIWASGRRAARQANRE